MNCRLLAPFSALFLMTMTSQSFAQTPIVMTPDTVYKAIQCDIGKFAASDGRYLDKNLEAHIKYVITEVRTEKVSISAKLSNLLKAILDGPSVEASHSREVTNDDTVEDDFNIHRKNRGACFNNHPDVGVLSCLTKRAWMFRQSKTARTSCNHKTVIAGKITASGKITWYVLTAGPEIDYDTKLTFDITVDLPKPKQKQAASL